MRVYTLWQLKDGGFYEIVDAIDEYAIDNHGVPDEYKQKQDEPRVRELIFDVPFGSVSALFEVPVVQVSAGKP